MKVNDLTIKFSHKRDVHYIEEDEKGHVHPIFKPGGETHVIIEGPNFQLTANSKCVEGDMFWKDKGRKIALKKALTKSTLDVDTKRAIWNEYRTMTKKPRW